MCFDLELVSDELEILCDFLLPKPKRKPFLRFLTVMPSLVWLSVACNCVSLWYESDILLVSTVCDVCNRSSDFKLPADCKVDTDDRKPRSKLWNVMGVIALLGWKCWWCCRCCGNICLSNEQVEKRLGDCCFVLPCSGADCTEDDVDEVDCWLAVLCCLTIFLVLFPVVVVVLVVVPVEVIVEPLLVAAAALLIVACGWCCWDLPNTVYISLAAISSELCDLNNRLNVQEENKRYSLLKCIFQFKILKQY